MFGHRQYIGLVLTFYWLWLFSVSISVYFYCFCFSQMTCARLHHRHQQNLGRRRVLYIQYSRLTVPFWYFWSFFPLFLPCHCAGSSGCLFTACFVVIRLGFRLQQPAHRAADCRIDWSSNLGCVTVRPPTGRNNVASAAAASVVHLFACPLSVGSMSEQSRPSEVLWVSECYFVCWLCTLCCQCWVSLCAHCTLIFCMVMIGADDDDADDDGGSGDEHHWEEEKRGILHQTCKVNVLGPDLVHFVK